MFQRRHYEAVAEAISAERKAMAQYDRRDELIGAGRITYKLAAAFKADNERFDTKRFLAACGITH